MRRKRGESTNQLLPSLHRSKRLNKSCENIQQRSSPLHDWYLDGHDEQTLSAIRKPELAELCKQRGIDIENQPSTKQDLVEYLIHWRKHALPPGADELIAKIPRNSQSLPNLAALAIGSAPQSAKVDYEGSEKKIVIFNVPEDEAYHSQEIEGGDLRYEELEFKRRIGSGAYKTVYRGKYRGQEVAIGEISADLLSEEDLKDIENEMKVLRQLHHDNVIKFIGLAKRESAARENSEKDNDGSDSDKETEEVNSNYYLVTEFCSHGDLSDYMQANVKPSFQRQLTIMYDIAFGCAYLHGRRPAIIHRDLKSLNILVNEKGVCKIGDFGFAKIKSRARAVMHTVVGTPNWQAPEMWTSNPNYTEKVDVYSCGLIFWEILNWSNNYPFGELQDHQIYEKVGKHRLRPSMNHLKKYPASIRKLIEEMWDQDPEMRPSMMSVVSSLSELLRSH